VHRFHTLGLYFTGTDAIADCPSGSLIRAYRRYVSPTSMSPFQTIRSLRPQDICEYMYMYMLRCMNCDKTYIGEAGRAFGVGLQDQQQKVSQRNVTKRLHAKHQKIRSNTAKQVSSHRRRHLSAAS